MPCLVAILALAFPRVILALVFLFSNYLQRAYQSWIWPLLGFLLMPLTTLAYAWAVNSYGGVEGVGLVAIVVAVLIDLGILGGSSRRRRSA
ncbi:MAG: hypothetical protein SFV54_18275 [Bryobacteraceae bacterium]|nr:hypothetical protein [Bryobacteraceae bacterium]